MLKLVILGAIVFSEIKGRIGEMSRLLQYNIPTGLIYIADTVFAICMKLAAVFVAVAAVDFLYQKYKWEKDMMMTKQEVKEEYKQLEGDPQIKGKRRQKQQQMAMARMMQAVPEADVIIRNPTHFAVALKYDQDKNNAPYQAHMEAGYLQLIEVTKYGYPRPAVRITGKGQLWLHKKIAACGMKI